MIRVLLVLVAILMQQAPTFRSGAEAVRVDVLVTDRGKPLSGLTAADFELLDNGVRQDIKLLEFDQLPLRIVLAFDMSASVTAERLERLRRAAGALLDGLSPRDRAGLITFSHAVAQRQPLTTDVSRLRDALARLNPAGGTALVDGAYVGLTVSEPQDGRALLVIFSDGLDTASWLPADAVLDTARRFDVVVYSVSTGREKPVFLRELSEATGGAAFENQSAEDLEKRFLNVLEEFRRRYILVYTPTGPATPGWHRLEVRVKGRRATVKARPGYMSAGAGRS
jgi:VWFA-related protein